ncbi:MULTISPECIES: GPW/gp25 family protein [unclassified Aureispira]|uniref:GPW/gp25 family protein n=1 Tax=unclassified Aureispira TaxID=2649989 RepID=UPI00069755AD|nr:MULTISPECIES: GPW/gp25 family protein [unclassified Aureispira]WMX14621.1 GPW/gp25 family protein [Aureispira sp. CCB-E]
MAENKSFLGSGWSFPPRFLDSTEGLELSHNDRDIAESIYILLSTTPGERVMNPGYGCNLQSMVFSSVTTSTKTRIEDLISTAILFYEPRVNLVAIEIDDTHQLEGKLEINIVYDIKGTNSRKNMVYPFYLTEGTDI